MNVHNSIIQSSQKMGTTQVSINWWIDREGYTHIENIIQQF